MASLIHLLIHVFYRIHLCRNFLGQFLGLNFVAQNFHGLRYPQKFTGFENLLSTKNSDLDEAKWIEWTLVECENVFCILGYHCIRTFGKWHGCSWWKKHYSARLEDKEYSQSIAQGSNGKNGTVKILLIAAELKFHGLVRSCFWQKVMVFVAD